MFFLPPKIMFLSFLFSKLEISLIDFLSEKTTIDSIEVRPLGVRLAH